MRKLHKGFSSVESLTVSPVALEILTRAEELYPHLPVFHKLNLLKFGYGTMNFDYGALQRILPCLKNMKKKKLRIGSSTSLFIDTAKTIKIWRFAATEKELYLIKVLLDVSSVLEKMYIWGGLSKQQEILMLPRLNKQ